MATSPFAKGGGGGGSVSSPFAKPKSGGGGGVGGFVGNFANDIKDAVVGLPMGLVETAIHPIRAARAFETTTWHTWSPLFHGDAGKFLHGVYDHPLAPLLDVMSVFTLGAGSAAKLGEVATATERLDAIAAGAKAETLGEKAAALRMPKSIERVDPTGEGRIVPAKQLSTRAGRRLVQEGTHKTMLAAADHLPKWFTQPVKEANFQRAFVSDTVHRHVAAMAQYAFAMKAGKIVSGTSPEDAVGRANVLAHNHQVLMLKAPGRAAKASEVPTGYGVVKAAEYLDPLARREVRKARRTAARWDKIRADNAEAAHSVESLSKQLQEANDTLRTARSQGIVQHGIPKGMPGWDKPNPTAKQLMNAQAAPIKEMEANVKRLEGQLTKARVARKIHDRATSELDALGQHIHAFNERSWGQHFTTHAATYESFQSYLGNLAKHAVIGGKTKRTLQKMEEMGARDEQGNLIIVPIHTAQALGHEAHSSSAFTRILWHHPARVWKLLQVGYSPRTIVNNGVGNWMLYMIRSDPVSGFMGMRDAIKYAKGPEASADFVNTAMSVDTHWLHDFKDELGSQQGLGESSVAPKKGGGFEMRDGAIHRAQQGLYPLVHKWSDEPVRASALSAYMRKDRGVLTLAREFKKKGLKSDTAFNRAVRARLKQDPTLHTRAVEYSRSIAGDYNSLTNMERHIRNVVPFYLWDRHIVKTGAALTLETPGRLAILQSVSNQGIDQAEKLLGPLPEFLKGAIPLSVLGLGGSGRANVLSTQGLNPFATLGDLAGAAEAATTGGGLNPGESLLGQTFPFISGTAEWALRKNLLTGGDIKNPGPLPTFLAEQVGGQIPVEKAIRALVSPQSHVTSKGNQTLYKKSATETLSALLGVPIKQVSLDAANGLAATQGGKKKPKSPFATTS